MRYGIIGSALALIALGAQTGCDDAGGYDAGYYDNGGQYAGGASGGSPPPNNGYAPPAGDEAPPEDPTAGEQYEHYGHNPFVDAEEDNQATFAIDVDTASYTLARRNLNRNILPQPAAVRVEEFVNFFEYDDAPPPVSDARPFAIHMEAAPSPFGDSAGGNGPDEVERALLRVNIRGIDIDDAERKPANLVFLVDVSGSMASPDKLGLVQYSLRRLTETLRDDDTIGIVVYAGAHGVALPPTPVSSASLIIEAVNRLAAGGGTNGEAGIRAAYGLAEQAFRPDGINRVLICTDGDFNVGLTGDALVNLIEQKRDEGITLTALGFGSGNYNDRTMEQLADRGNGNYAYIDRMEEAERVLVEDLTSTLQVIAKDVKIQVELNPDVVRRYRLIGYENRDIRDEDFRNDRVDAGEIGAGHQVTAYLELELYEDAWEDDAQALASASVRYKAPEATAEDAALEEVLKTMRLSAMSTDFSETTSSFQFGAAVVEFAEILRASPHSRGARFDEIRAIALAHAGARPERQELSLLVERARLLWSN